MSAQVLASAVVSEGNIIVDATAVLVIVGTTANIIWMNEAVCLYFFIRYVDYCGEHLRTLLICEL